MLWSRREAGPRLEAQKQRVLVQQRQTLSLSTSTLKKAALGYLSESPLKNGAIVLHGPHLVVSINE